MATIVKTPSGTWKALIRKTGWPTTAKTFRTKRDAEDWARRTEDEMVRGMYIQRGPSERMTIADALISSSTRWNTTGCFPEFGAKGSVPLPMMPRFTVERVRQKLDTSFPTANAAVKVLEDLGIATKMTGQKKYCSYSYQAYIELLSR